MLLMRFAYADPPYPGNARKLYRNEAVCKEVNHAVLIATLEAEYDGWALSTGSVNLKEVLPLCPASVRVGAWVKPMVFYRPGVNPAYGWEPVIFKPLPRKVHREKPTVRDWVSCNTTRQTGLAGTKPQAFSDWLFDIMRSEPEDEFYDLFPGSGAVMQAWEARKIRQALPGLVA